MSSLMAGRLQFFVCDEGMQILLLKSMNGSGGHLPTRLPPPLFDDVFHPRLFACSVVCLEWVELTG